MDDARRMRGERCEGATFTVLAQRFDVPRSLAHRICAGYSYREKDQPRKYQPREAISKTAVCENCDSPFRYWHRRIDPPRRFCKRRCNLLFANRDKRKLPSGEELSRLYHLRGWSLQRIALRYGCCFQAVHYAMQRAGIKRRSRKVGQSTRPKTYAGIMAALR